MTKATRKILVSKREQQVLDYFANHVSATIEEIALHFTGESRQNLFNPGVFRFKQLGVLECTEMTRETTNGGIARVYVRGENFHNVKVLSPETTTTVRKFQRLAKELGVKKKGTRGAKLKYQSAQHVASAIKSGSLSANSIPTMRTYHKTRNPAYAEMLRQGLALSKRK